MIVSFPAAVNFNRIFLKLNRFICNQLPVLPDPWYWELKSSQTTHAMLIQKEGYTESLLVVFIHKRFIMMGRQGPNSGFGDFLFIFK